VKIKFAEFWQATRSRILRAIVASQDALRDVSIVLVRTVFPPAKGIRLVGMTLSSFEVTLLAESPHNAWRSMRQRSNFLRLLPGANRMMGEHILVCII
jgi:hypothetical protein